MTRPIREGPAPDPDNTSPRAGGLGDWRPNVIQGPRPPARYAREDRHRVGRREYPNRAPQDHPMGVSTPHARRRLAVAIIGCLSVLLLLAFFTPALPTAHAQDA